MADVQNNTTEAATPAKLKTVKADMPVRRIFTAERDDSGAVTKTALEQATAYLNQAMTDYSDFEKVTLAARGMDDEGDFDPEIYTESMDVMVGVLKNKVKGGESVVKAITVSPIPVINDDLWNNEAARDWIKRILHKEMSHVSVRALREADDVTTVIDQMPVDLAGFIESGRAATGIGVTFDELYKIINQALAAKIPVWARYKLVKSELKRGMESAGYAAELYPALEDYKGQSLFVGAIQLGIRLAKDRNLDPTIFERWLSTRDQKIITINGASGEDDEDFNADSLMEGLLSDSEEDETESAEKPGEDGAADNETASDSQESENA